MSIDGGGKRGEGASERLRDREAGRQEGCWELPRTGGRTYIGLALLLLQKPSGILCGLKLRTTESAQCPFCRTAAELKWLGRTSGMLGLPPIPNTHSFSFPRTPAWHIVKLYTVTHASKRTEVASIFLGLVLTNLEETEPLNEEKRSDRMHRNRGGYDPHTPHHHNLVSCTASRPSRRDGKQAVHQPAAVPPAAA